MNRVSALSLTLLFFIFSQCSTQTTVEVERAKNTVFRLIEADNRSDIKTVLNCYIDSIELYPVGAQPIIGIENVRSNYEKLFANYKMSITTRITEAKVVHNNGYVKGFNTVDKTSLLDSTVQHQTDQYIAFLVKSSDGEWKISKLLWGFK